MIFSPLAAATAVCAALSISGALAGVPLLAGPFKVATTALIICHAWRRSQGGSLDRAVIAGLVLSLAGDAFLIFPWGFLPGLVSFLLAHLAYLTAFTGGLREWRPIAPLFAYAVIVSPILIALWPAIPEPLRLPVAAYVLAIACMAATAAARWLRLKERGGADEKLALLAAVGAALFVISDAVLATHKFAGPVALAPLLNLSAYWLAQWLIASSLPMRGDKKP
jgi:uncharacterized membrane protein YhhN